MFGRSIGWTRMEKIALLFMQEISQLRGVKRVNTGFGVNLTMEGTAISFSEKQL